MPSGRRLSFNPNKYKKSSLSDTSSVRIKSNEIIVTKGDTQQILDTAKLKAACQKLKRYWRTNIRELDNEGKSAFETLTLHIGALYNTEAYPIVYDIVHNEYLDLIKEDNIEAGTISGYIGGCAIEKHFKDQLGCGVYCAGAMPMLGKQSGCKYPVMLATYNGNSYSFHLMQDSDDRKNTIIYCNSQHHAGGFSDEEKQALKNFKIENVNVMLYNKNEYKQVHGGFISIDKLPTRGVEVQPVEALLLASSSSEQVNTGHESTVLVILLIVLILLGLFVAWRFMSKC